jgi:hypothetical protein
MKGSLAAAALAGAVALFAPGAGSAQTQQPSAPTETPESLPDFPGRDLAFGFCAGCHSFQLIGRQGMSRERWDSTLTWMSDRHGMPVPDADIRKELLDYLEQAYPERRTAPGGWQNPFAPTR